MSHTTSPAEWVAAGCLGVTAIGVIAFGVAFADTDPADLDPRPALYRFVESGRLDPLLIAAGPALWAARQAVSRTATAVVLAFLLRLTAPEGATR